MTAPIHLTLSEWQTATPETHPQLARFTFPDHHARTLAATLADTGRLQLLQLASGLRVTTNSHVGRVQVGPLHITIQPKIQRAPLLTLLRYAYRLRDLHLHQPLHHPTGHNPFHDLLIHQLHDEIQELSLRGLHRAYTRRDAALTTPQGRLNFTHYIQQAATATAALPCTIHPRLHDNPLNRALRDGLHLATHLTADLHLRARLRRLAQQLDLATPARPLTTYRLHQARRHLDRRTAAYRPALRLLRLLLAGATLTLQTAPQSVTLPGFLFDMNRFFQDLLSRFLRENLPAYTVRDQHRLRHMMAYLPGYNPRRRHSPAPRPDYLITRHSRVHAILDAKYKDLWENTIPAADLYQLAIYALSRPHTPHATILYPTTTPRAREAHIQLRDPAHGHPRALIIQRPLNLLHLAHLLTTPTSPRHTQAFAHLLAFGHEDQPSP